MTVVGLDMSLTCTGMAAIQGGSNLIATHRVKSSGKKGATVRDTALRLEELRQEIMRWLVRLDGAAVPSRIDLAVIESPSFGSKGGSAHERGGLWWSVASELACWGVPIATVAPKTREKYAMGVANGKGPEGKTAVKLAVQARYGHLADIPDDNVADAVVLAAMGARWLKRPIDNYLGLPTGSLVAMRSAKWPE